MTKKQKHRVTYREGNVLYPEAFIQRIYKNNWEQLQGLLELKTPKARHRDSPLEGCTVPF